LDSKIHGINERRSEDAIKDAASAISIIVSSVSEPLLARLRATNGWGNAINTHDLLRVWNMVGASVDGELGARLIAGHKALINFINIKRTGTVEEYYEEFQRARSEAVRLGMVMQSETRLAYHFINGLSAGFEVFTAIATSKDPPYATLHDAVMVSANWTLALLEPKHELITVVGSTAAPHTPTFKLGYSDKEWGAPTFSQKADVRRRRRNAARKRANKSEEKKPDEKKLDEKKSQFMDAPKRKAEKANAMMTNSSNDHSSDNDDDD
jgi:hypothetical protein